MPESEIKAVLDRIDRLDLNNREDHRQVFDLLRQQAVMQAECVKIERCAECRQSINQNIESAKGWPPAVTIYVAVITAFMTVLATLLAVRW